MRFTRAAAAIGIPSVAIDGNDVECVQNSAGEAIARARAGDGPSFIEAQTYRLRGHAEAEVYWLSERYRTDDEIARWQAKDPLLLFAEKLQRDRVADAKELAAVDTAVTKRIADAAQLAAQGEAPTPALLQAFIHDDVAAAEDV